MSFIEDRIAERDRLNIDKGLILEHVGSLWDGLWGVISGHVDRYRAKYGQGSVITNGTWDQHNLRIPLEVINGTPVGTKDTLAISRAQNSPVITAGNFKFECRICKDGIVCITLQGQEISLEEAAIKILDPFLFPDLPRLP